MVRKASSVEELLRRAKVEVLPGTFALAGLRHDDWRRLLENPELSPRPESVFMLLKDAHEVTLLVEEEDWRVMRHAAPDARVEASFRLITIDLELGWEVVGFLAHICAMLAAANIPVGALSAFSRDHLLIKQADLGTALRVLGEHVEELC